LNATTEQQRKGIADYFSPNVPIARIHEARMEGDQLRLVMAGGVEIAADQVEALRMP
jgi:hypothetical protein